MSDRHDLRRQTREIREALSRFEPEQLVDILTHIFRQYVMEGGAAPASSVSLQDELQGLSFPQLVERLQLRLDLPELRLLEVAGGRVMCRVDGRLVPLEVPDTRAPEPLPVMRVNNIQQIQISAQPVTAAATSAATNAPPPSVGTQSQEMASAVPGVRPVGHSGSGRPDGTASQTARPAAATARSAAPAPGPAARPASPAPAASGPAASAPARPEKPAPPEKPDNGGRFNLLEID